MRRRVTGTSNTPNNWRSFLRDESNKTELFHFLADKICEAQTTSTLIVTKGEDAISNTRKPLDTVSPCCHEEADTRIFVHCRDATTDGSPSSPSSSRLMTQTSSSQQCLYCHPYRNLVLRTCGLPLAKESIFDGFQFMRYIVQSGLRKLVEYHTFMRSLDVMLCLPSVVKGRRQHGRLGTSVMRFLKPSPISASIQHQLVIQICNIWRDLLS